MLRTNIIVTLTFVFVALVSHSQAKNPTDKYTRSISNVVFAQHGIYTSIEMTLDNGEIWNYKSARRETDFIDELKDQLTIGKQVNISPVLVKESFKLTFYNEWTEDIVTVKPISPHPSNYDIWLEVLDIRQELVEEGGWLTIPKYQFLVELSDGSSWDVTNGWAPGYYVYWISKIEHHSGPFDLEWYQKFKKFHFTFSTNNWSKGDKVMVIEEKPNNFNLYNLYADPSKEFDRSFWNASHNIIDQRFVFNARKYESSS